MVAAPVAAGEISGELQLLMKSGDRVSKTAKPSDAVIYFEPARPAPAAATAAAEHLVTTRNKEFDPHVLVVARGSTVRFPNEDPILHNVFSVSPDNSFDLGLYNRGPGKEWTFESAGVVRVYCNVHKSMAAYVLVLSTPYVARPQSSGRFVLGSLPEGPGKLTVWHERAEPLELDVVVSAEPMERELALRITKPRLAAHNNKLGRPYERSDGEY